VLTYGDMQHLFSAYGYWAVGALVALESMAIPLPAAARALRGLGAEGPAVQTAAGSQLVSPLSFKPRPLLSMECHRFGCAPPASRLRRRLDVLGNGDLVRVAFTTL
jgi:hypothetical protein